MSFLNASFQIFCLSCIVKGQFLRHFPITATSIILLSGGFLAFSIVFGNPWLLLISAIISAFALLPNAPLIAWYAIQTSRVCLYILTNNVVNKVFTRLADYMDFAIQTLAKYAHYSSAPIFFHFVSYFVILPLSILHIVFLSIAAVFGWSNLKGSFSERCQQAFQKINHQYAAEQADDIRRLTQKFEFNTSETILNPMRAKTMQKDTGLIIQHEQKKTHSNFFSRSKRRKGCRSKRRRKCYGRITTKTPLSLPASI